MNFIKKICIFITLCLFFFNTNSYSEVINKIDVIGNERISLETIVVFGDISIGKDYDVSDVNILIKKLYDTTFFSNISVEIENNKLIIVVKENPIINLIVFNGEKAKKFKTKIKELLILREKGSFISSRIKQDINMVKSFYKHQGFYFVEIDVQIETLE